MLVKLASARATRWPSCRQRVCDGRRPGELDHRAVDREAGVGIEDLRARVAEHQHRERHRDLAAGDNDDLAGVDLDAEAAGNVAGDRLAQLGDPAGRRVAVVTVDEGPTRGLDDVRRGRKVGLTDAEVDHRAAARREGLRPREHLERALGPERCDVGGELHCRRPKQPACRDPVPCNFSVIRASRATGGRFEAAAGRPPAAGQKNHTDRPVLSPRLNAWAPRCQSFSVLFASSMKSLRWPPAKTQR